MSASRDSGVTPSRTPHRVGPPPSWTTISGTPGHRDVASGNENDFAEGAGSHDILVSLSCFGKRELLADDGAHRAVLEAGNESGMNLFPFRLRDAPQVEGPNGSPADHEVARGDGDVAAAADDDDAAVRREQLQVRAEIHVGEHFEDDVHAAAAGGLENRVLVAGFGVIEDLMRAFELRDVEALLRACAADDDGAHGARNRDSGYTETAACAVDE